MDSASARNLFDPWTREYARLGLRMDRLLPGTVDGWIGPTEWKAEIERESMPRPESLRDSASSLIDRLPGMRYESRREIYLRKQVAALEAMARISCGEEMDFRDQARVFFDIEPEREPEATFERAHAALEDALPGTGPLGERLEQWRSSLRMSPEGTEAMLQPAVEEVRRRTTEHFPLPRGEGVDLTIVRNKPWGAYNWYLGNFRSLIEVNVDIPLTVITVPDYMAHEGYPGHHTEHALRESRQYRAGGQGEYSILLINTPESVISEAIATSAHDLIFEGNESLEWLASEASGRIGLTIDVAQTARIQGAVDGLEGVSANAAFMLAEDERSPREVAQYIEHWGLSTPERAQKGLEFLSNPLWRVYTFTYRNGRKLLAPLLRDETKFAVFERVSTEPVYPSFLAGWNETGRPA